MKAKKKKMAKMKPADLGVDLAPRIEVCTFETMWLKPSNSQLFILGYQCGWPPSERGWPDCSWCRRARLQTKGKRLLQLIQSTSTAFILYNWLPWCLFNFNTVFCRGGKITPCITGVFTRVIETTEMIIWVPLNEMVNQHQGLCRWTNVPTNYYFCPWAVWLYCSCTTLGQ